MVKAEKAEEITKKIKRMGEENQVEDEIENANKMAGLGYKINHKIFDKMNTRVVDPNKNFYKLEGANIQELEAIKEKARTGRLTKRISKKPKLGSTKDTGENKVKFVKRSKAERMARRSKIPKGRKMN
jgi:molybdenum cofactor biosynthesis enzyme MoaA